MTHQKLASLWNNNPPSFKMSLFGDAYGPSFVLNAPCDAWTRKWSQLNKYEKHHFERLVRKLLIVK